MLQSWRLFQICVAQKVNIHVQSLIQPSLWRHYVVLVSDLTYEGPQWVGSRRRDAGESTDRGWDWQTVRMRPSEFAAFYERYRGQCINAGVKPLTPEAMQDTIAQWESLGLWWDTEPQKTRDDDNQREQLTH